MDTSQGVSSEETTYTVQACFPNARSLLLAVQAIKPSTKQSCELIFEQNGLNIRWQHESKALHSAISLNSSVSPNSYNLSDLPLILQLITRSPYTAALGSLPRHGQSIHRHPFRYIIRYTCRLCLIHRPPSSH